MLLSVKIIFGLGYPSCDLLSGFFWGWRLTRSSFRGGGYSGGGSNGYSNGHSGGYGSYGGGGGSYGGGSYGGGSGDRMSNLGAGLKTQHWGKSTFNLEILTSSR